MNMNEEKFKSILSTFARWYTPYIRDGNTGLKKPPVNANPNDINPTLGPVIEELLLTPSPCDWCGKIVNQEATHQRRLPSTDREPQPQVWVSHCKTCGLYKNPITEQMQRHYPVEVPSIKTWSAKRRSTFNRIKR